MLCSTFTFDFRILLKNKRKNINKNFKNANSLFIGDFDKYHKIVTESPHDFTSWEYLIRLAEAEGNHQKSSQVLSEFLGYFPLCYGYWKKYADNELAAGGDMRATEVFFFFYFYA